MLIILIKMILITILLLVVGRLAKVVLLWIEWLLLIVVINVGVLDLLIISWRLILRYLIKLAALFSGIEAFGFAIPPVVFKIH